MRLECPNCGAQYEVPAEVIPAEGRDVQCSNCGGTWFQRHPDDAEVEETAAPASTLDPAPDTVEAGEAGETARSEPAPERAAPEPVDPRAAAPRPAAPVEDTGTSAPGDDPDADPDLSDAPPAAAALPPKRKLDPKVQGLLREEAEREAKARARDTSDGLESQPDLGLGEPETEAQKREREARERMAKLRGKTVPPRAAARPAGGDAEVAAGSRRDLLPDIEEINSSLRSKGVKKQPAEASVDPGETARQRRGFRIGFGLTLLVTALLILLYQQADWVSENWPGTRGAVGAWVDVADSARLWLDGQVQKLQVWLDSRLDTPD